MFGSWRVSRKEKILRKIIFLYLVVKLCLVRGERKFKGKKERKAV